MDADELLRAVGGGGEAGNRDRRCVGSDQRGGFKDRAKLRERLALDFLILRNRLDHNVAIGELVEARRRLDVLEPSLALLLRDTITAYLPCHIAVDRG